MTKDVYEVDVESSVQINVEDINEALAVITAVPVLQEDLTQRLWDRLSIADRVTTRGSHSGVQTEVRC